MLSTELNQRSHGVFGFLTLRKQANRQLMATNPFMPAWGGELYILDEVYGSIAIHIHRRMR